MTNNSISIYRINWVGVHIYTKERPGLLETGIDGYIINTKRFSSVPIINSHLKDRFLFRCVLASLYIERGWPLMMEIDRK